VGWHPELAIAVMSPAAEEARRILRGYFDDVASRYYGRAATGDEIAAAMSEDPSDDLVPPTGLLLVAQGKGDVLGCAGLRLLPVMPPRSLASSWFPQLAAWGSAPGSLTVWRSTHADTGYPRCDWTPAVTSSKHGGYTRVTAIGKLPRSIAALMPITGSRRLSPDRDATRFP
jgi:hypothetical protein